MTKKKLILNPYIPPRNYQFPYSEHQKNGCLKKRYAHHRYLEAYEWLVFSDVKKGFLCKYCVLFVTHKNTGANKQKIFNSLVSVPLQKFAKLTGVDGSLETHNKRQYHLDAVNAAKDFLLVLEKPEIKINNQLDTLRVDTIKKNRERLLPIVKTIILLGRQNIPFRGHRDDGIFKFNNLNQGNFRAVLEYRAETDLILKNHLLAAPHNATHVSKTTQNELIDCCKDEILSQIICQVQCAQFFSILFDEATDLTNKSQLSLLLRYVRNGTIFEQFVEFIDTRKEIFGNDDPEEYKIDKEIDEEVVKLTGAKIGKLVIDKIKQLNLNINNCIGISTDDCSTMTSEACGAVSTIQKEAVNAIHCPCQNHALNLSISHTSKVTAIRNSVSIMKQTCFFLNASSKRSALLAQKLDRKLIDLCETRWSERHDAVLQFRHLLPNIRSALESISKWKERDCAIKAAGLWKSLGESSTIIAIFCLSDLLTCTKSLSIYFQQEKIDLKTARYELNLTLNQLERRREKAEQYFNNLYLEICDVAEHINCKISIPRIVERQSFRENYSTNNIEDYYRQSIYIPALDNMVEDLKNRFSKNTLDVYNLSTMFPRNDFHADVECLKELIRKYQSFLEYSPEIVLADLIQELERWNLHWDNKKEETESIGAIDLLNECNAIIYPRINFFLRISCTLSVSNASAERSFSALKRLLTWMRTTMTEDRLVGLALLHIHKDMTIDPYKIIDRFATKKKRRIEFTI